MFTWQVSDVSSPTRERIVDEAMRLFAERGLRGTSVADIESAAGLSPGSGGLYHHFPSKDAVLAEGVARQLSRLDALRDIRRVFAGLGDIRAQLAITARYYLAELDNQTDLLRLLAAEARRRPDLLTEAVDQLVSQTYESFAEWISEATGTPAGKARAVAHVGLAALLGSRLTREVFGTVPTSIDDEELVSTWTEMMDAVVGSEPRQ